jgi:hypothetical protein
MVVLTQNRKSGVMGLHVGSGNVQRYFPRNMEMVELELDHLRIICTLDAAFWEESPEIHDMRLSLWLEMKRVSGKIKGNSAPIALIPVGIRVYRLQVTVEEPIVAQVAEFVSPMETLVPDLGGLPPGQVERRARRRPVVRELGRLKGNELPVTAAIH